MTQPNIKILVGYHKPARLFKSDIYIPIHLGRSVATQASKDGVISEADYKWMLDNMIGDDTGDNISCLNRYFSELTGIYWAWKNYDKLGNPEYIGFAHYRRMFKHKDIETAQQYDITAKYANFNKSIKVQFAAAHDIKYLNKAIDILGNMYPEYKSDAKKYLNSQDGYWYNMFIMKKELFFEYCEILFNVLLDLHKKTKNHTVDSYQRMPGFVAERLTGVFITHKNKTCSVNNVDIVFLPNEKSMFEYKMKKILHTFLSYITFGKTSRRQKLCAENYKNIIEI